jgi:hypothetical protein
VAVFTGDVAVAFEKDADLGNVSASYLGEAEDDHLSPWICGAGDVNGDGFDDFLMGSASNGQAGTGAGKAYLVLGKALGWHMDTDASEADASFLGDGEYQSAGASLAPAGDVDGDGYDDFLVGASNAYYTMGGAYLVLGRANGWTPDQSLAMADAFFAGETQDDGAGKGVNGVGDVNGDGLDDFTVGAPDTWEAWDSRGKVYLLLGRSTGWPTFMSLANADASFTGGFDSNGTASGQAAGDVDGDGFDDFAFSDSYDEDGDQHDGTYTFLFQGQPDTWGHDMDFHDAETSFLGASCRSIGDVNGDAGVDLACYSKGEDESGETHLFLDGPSLLHHEVEMSGADASFLGEGPGDWAGKARGEGDLNGDGFDDLVIRAMYNDQNGPAAGKVYLLLGHSVGWVQDTSLTEADASWLGEEGGDHAGRSAAVAGDVNGDGFDDILVGSYYNSESARDAGQVYLILGEPQLICPGDHDSDGYANPGNPDCPNGEETDCDDSDAWVNPAMTEDCADGVDNDCDGDVDGADADCPEADDDDSADDDTAADDDATDDDTTTPDDDDCQCRNHAGPNASPLALLGLSTLLLCWRRFR